MDLDHDTMLLKLRDDSIKNVELYQCLNSKNFNLIGLAIYKIIDRKYCDDLILDILNKIAKCLKGYKIVGAYQLGHLAIAALYLVNDELSIKKFREIYEGLDENDRFWVENFIKGMQDKSSV